MNIWKKKSNKNCIILEEEYNYALFLTAQLGIHPWQLFVAGRGEEELSFTLTKHTVYRSSTKSGGGHIAFPKSSS